MRLARPVLCIIVFVFIHSWTHAQPRTINFQIIARDSVKVFYDGDYQLIDSPCAQIIRYGRFDFQREKFFGRFKDVNKDDTTQILCEGNYDGNGLKNGEFAVYYLNGKLHAKGNFINNKYAGKWEFFNKTGSPQMTFTVVNGIISITDVWDNYNLKTVSSGNGKYQIDFLSTYYWTGNFADGKQDGTWRLMQKNNPDSVIVLTEYFEKGKFMSGGNKVTNYSDSSHIILVDPNALNLVNAEYRRISPISCDEVKIRKIFTGASFVGGNASTMKFLKTLADGFIIPYFRKTKHVRLYKGFIMADGEIDGKGHLINVELDDRENFDKKRFINKLTNIFPQVNRQGPMESP